MPTQPEGKECKAAVHPHPDHAHWDFVTVTPQLAKQLVSRLLARAAKKSPINEIQDETTLYRVRLLCRCLDLRWPVTVQPPAIWPPHRAYIYIA